jgi:hypothetical protein
VKQVIIRFMDVDKMVRAVGCDRKAVVEVDWQDAKEGELIVVDKKGTVRKLACLKNSGSKKSMTTADGVVVKVIE